MDQWEHYRHEMYLWSRLGRPAGYEPMRPWQEGQHLDTLPVQCNRPAPRQRSQLVLRDKTGAGSQETDHAPEG